MTVQSPDNEPLCLVFIPALVAILHRAETVNGSPLNQAQVEAIRDKAVCMTMRYSHARELEEKRGYHDIRPENCWEDWQRARAEISAVG